MFVYIIYVQTINPFYDISYCIYPAILFNNPVDCKNRINIMIGMI